MTNAEIKDKIADLEKRVKNPSLPASAVAALNKKIAELKSEIKTEPKPAEPKKAEPKAEPTKTEPKKKAEPTPKYKVGEILIHKDSGKTYRVKIEAVTGWTGEEHRYDVEFLDDNLKPLKKYAKSYDSSLSRTDKGKKAEPKEKPTSKMTDDEYNAYCAELMAKAKERKAKAKAAAAKRANEPKKTPATKNKEAVRGAAERVEKNVEKRVEKGDVKVAEIEKIILEYEEAIRKLKALLKKAKTTTKFKVGGSVNSAEIEAILKNAHSVKDSHCGCNDKMAKGGLLKDKANYIPNRMITTLEVERNGRITDIDPADVLDGIYVKKRVKYAEGGGVGELPKSLQRRIDNLEGRLDITKEKALEAYRLHIDKGYGGSGIGYELFNAKNQKESTTFGDLAIDLGRFYSEKKYAEGGVADGDFGAEKAGERKSRKYSTVELKSGGEYTRRNANQYGKAKGGRTYTENRPDHSDKRRWI